MSQSKQQKKAATTVWDTIEMLFRRYDGHLELEVASRCCWSGELRLTVSDPTNAPARSIVFYSMAGASPEDVAERLLADVHDWLAEGYVPLPPPYYKQR
jgi:hypothetical protein